MTVKQLLEVEQVSLVVGEQWLDRPITAGYVGDLLSVVMGTAPADCAWITIQGHLNIVAVASLVEVACIIVAQDSAIEQDTIQKAEAEQIVLLKTGLTSYQMACKLCELGIKG